MSGIDGGIPALIAALKERDLSRRHEAEEVLARAGAAAVEPLIRAIREETDPDFRWYAARALARVGQPVIGPLSRALEDPDETVRSCATLVLWQMGEEGVEALGKALLGKKGDAQDAPREGNRIH